MRDWCLVIQVIAAIIAIISTLYYIVKIIIKWIKEKHISIKPYRTIIFVVIVLIIGFSLGLFFIIKAIREEPLEGQIVQIIKPIRIVFLETDIVGQSIDSRFVGQRVWIYTRRNDDIIWNRFGPVKIVQTEHGGTWDFSCKFNGNKGDNFQVFAFRTSQRRYPYSKLNSDSQVPEEFFSGEEGQPLDWDKVVDLRLD